MKGTIAAASAVISLSVLLNGCTMYEEPTQPNFSHYAGYNGSSYASSRYYNGYFDHSYWDGTDSKNYYRADLLNRGWESPYLSY